MSVAPKQTKSKRNSKRTKLRKAELNGVLVEILMLLRRHRPEELTFARIARHTGVPRSTLYYYFGSSRMGMLNEAMRLGMSKFVQLNEVRRPGRVRSWKQFETARLTKSIRRMTQFPWIMEIYFRYRSNPGPLGETIRQFEELYFREMQESWKRFYGRPASPEAIRFSGYLKLGLFYGIGQDRNLWKSGLNLETRKGFLEHLAKHLEELYASSCESVHKDLQKRPS